MHVSVHRPISRNEPQQPMPTRRNKKGDFPRRNFGKEFPRGNLKEVRAALKEDRKRTEERNRAPRDHKFALRFEILCLAHARTVSPVHTFTHTCAGWAYKFASRNKDRPLSDVGWLAYSGGWLAAVAWCSAVWCGVVWVPLASEVGRRE